MIEDFAKPGATAIVTDLSEEAQRKLEVIQSLIEPCDRITYGQKLRDAATKLGRSTRTVQRLVKKWETEGVSALVSSGRADKGHYRISEFWQDFIIKTYKSGNKGSKRMNPKQVSVRVRAKALEMDDPKPPTYRTVLRVLKPLQERKKQAQSIRSPGWRGATVSMKTRAGRDLIAEYSNQVWQCDHTQADILLVDQHGELLGRPWLTTIIDSYSRCIVGVNLGFDAPSSQVVALAIRNAILPKRYGADYKLNCEWGTFGSPEHFYTDGGKDFRSNHLQLVATDLGFTCHLRRRPSEGGIVERPFGTFNTQLFSTLPGYTGSNVQERPKEAEKEACLTLRELEHLIVRFICDRYNQSIDARMGDQTRFQRWEAGLPRVPAIVDERELDICLMKASRRLVQRGGCIQFENLLYRGEHLAGYAGETVSLRFDPNDITAILIYRREDKRETFLVRAYAQGLETEQLSYEEAKASSRKIREAGKTLSNASILQESIEREALIKKKSRKQRQKDEQKLAKAQSTPKMTGELPESDVDAVQPDIDASIDVEVFEPIDFDEMRGGW